MLNQVDFGVHTRERPTNSHSSNCGDVTLSVLLSHEVWQRKSWKFSLTFFIPKRGAVILCVAPMGIFWLSYKRKEDRSTGMEKVHKHAAKSEKKIYLIYLTQTTRHCCSLPVRTHREVDCATATHVLTLCGCCCCYIIITSLPCCQPRCNSNN